MPRTQPPGGAEATSGTVAGMRVPSGIASDSTQFGMRDGGEEASAVPGAAGPAPGVPAAEKTSLGIRGSTVAPGGSGDAVPSLGADLFEDKRPGEGRTLYGAHVLDEDEESEGQRGRARPDSSTPIGGVSHETAFGMQVLTETDDDGASTQLGAKPAQVREDPAQSTTERSLPDIGGGAPPAPRLGRAAEEIGSISTDETLATQTLGEKRGGTLFGVRQTEAFDDSEDVDGTGETVQLDSGAASADIFDSGMDELDAEFDPSWLDDDDASSSPGLPEPPDATEESRPSGMGVLRKVRRKRRRGTDASHASKAVRKALWTGATDAVGAEQGSSTPSPSQPNADTSSGSGIIKRASRDRLPAASAESDDALPDFSDAMSAAFDATGGSVDFDSVQAQSGAEERRPQRSSDNHEIPADATIDDLIEQLAAGDVSTPAPSTQRVEPSGETQRIPSGETAAIDQRASHETVALDARDAATDDTSDSLETPNFEDTASIDDIGFQETAAIDEELVRSGELPGDSSMDDELSMPTSDSSPSEEEFDVTHDDIAGALDLFASPPDEADVKTNIDFSDLELSGDFASIEQEDDPFSVAAEAAMSDDGLDDDFADAETLAPGEDDLATDWDIGADDDTVSPGDVDVDAATLAPGDGPRSAKGTQLMSSVDDDFGADDIGLPDDSADVPAAAPAKTPSATPAESERDLKFTPVKPSADAVQDAIARSATRERPPWLPWAIGGGVALVVLAIIAFFVFG